MGVPQNAASWPLVEGKAILLELCRARQIKRMAGVFIFGFSEAEKPRMTALMQQVANLLRTGKVPPWHFCAPRADNGVSALRRRGDVLVVLGPDDIAEECLKLNWVRRSESEKIDHLKPGCTEEARKAFATTDRGISFIMEGGRGIERDEEQRVLPPILRVEISPQPVAIKRFVWRSVKASPIAGKSLKLNAH